MWLLSFMVQDKHFAAAYSFLDNPPPGAKFKVVAVNVPKRLAPDELLPKKSRKWLNTGGRAKEPITQLKLTKGETLTAKEFAHRLPSIGWSPNSYCYARNKLLKEKLIRKTKDGRIEVL